MCVVCRSEQGTRAEESEISEASDESSKKTTKGKVNVDEREVAVVAMSSPSSLVILPRKDLPPPLLDSPRNTVPIEQPIVTMPPIMPKLRHSLRTRTALPPPPLSSSRLGELSRSNLSAISLHSRRRPLPHDFNVRRRTGLVAGGGRHGVGFAKHGKASKGVG